MDDYIIQEDAFVALTRDITDCTIEEFIARLRDKLSKLSSAKTHNDAISRSEALSYIDKVLNSGMGKQKALKFIKKHIELMQDVKPEKKTGKWLKMSDFNIDDRYKCSYCGNVVHYNDRVNLYTFNRWCGRCGSKNDE